MLSHALERGLRIVVVVNKIDRPNADPEGAVDKVFDLMVELGASDEQLDFPVVYASAEMCIRDRLCAARERQGRYGLNEVRGSAFRRCRPPSAL